MANDSSGNSTAEPNPKVADEVHFIVLAFLIIAVNLCVIVVVWKKNILHKWQNYLLVSLAFSDLSTGLFGLPTALACTLDFNSSRSCIFCSVSYTFTKFISISTILHLLTVTYERFVFIVYPFRHERLSAKPIRFKLALAAIWSISLTVAVVPFAWIDLDDCDGQDNEKHWLVYNVTTLILFLAIPMILFIFAFVSMFLVARVHIRKQERLMLNVPGSENPTALNTTLRKEARVAIIFAVMWIIFVICWGPYFAYNIMDELGEDLADTFAVAADVLRFLTSLLNPLLYSFAKKDFCQALSRTCLTRRVLARQCCLPYDRRRTEKQEVPMHSNAARGLSETGNRGLITQLSTV